MASSNDNLTLVLDDRAGGPHADRIAVVADDAVLDYRELLGSVCRYGNALRAVGVRRGTRILIALRDSPWFISALLGAIRLGALPFLVSPDLSASQRAEHASDSDAEMLILDAVDSDASNSQAVRTITIGELREVAAQQSPELASVKTSGSDAAFVLYSSGSTGRPKGAVHSHRGPRFTFESFGKGVLDVTPDDVLYSAGKMYHAYGLGNSVWIPLWAGATVVVDPRRPTRQAVKELAIRHQPTILFLMPPLCAALAAEDDASWCRSARVSVSASEPLPAQVWQQWTDRVGVPLLDGIGSTEMLHFYCTNRIDRIAPGAAGVPVPGCELTIVDDDGAAIEGAGTGRLTARSDSMFSEYWRQPERSRAALAEGRFDTRDIVERDEAGVIWYRGRADELFKIGGLWVSPARIEECLKRHSAVRDAGVVGLMSSAGMRTRAVVVAQEGADLQTLRQVLRAHCAQELPRNEIPHIVEFANELPRTPTGKLQRFRL